MHMPVLYRELNKLKKCENCSEAEKAYEARNAADHPWKTINSTPMLVMIPEPDYSMPFNVNAVTFGLLGVFMINMYNTLVKPKRFVTEIWVKINNN